MSTLVTARQVATATATADRRWLRIGLLAALGGLVAFQVAVLVYHLGAELAFPFDLNYGEGYVLNDAVRLAHGLPLYVDLHEYRLSRFTLFLPFFGRYADEETHEATTIAPLFYRHSTPTNVTMVGFPLVWDFKRGPERTTVVFPFYAHWRRADHTGTTVP